METLILTGAIKRVHKDEDASEQKENMPIAKRRRCVSFNPNVEFTDVPSKNLYPVVCALLELHNGRTEAFTRTKFNHHINYVRQWAKESESRQKQLLRAYPPSKGVRLHVLLFCGAVGYGETERLLGVEHGNIYSNVIRKYNLAADMLDWKFCADPVVFDRVHRKIASMFVFS